MSDNSKIEWTDSTWTPIRARFHEIQDDGSGKERIGWHCEHVSEGCRHCYAEMINRRLGTGLDFKPGALYRAEHEGYRNGEAKLFLDEKMLLAPLRWKKPRMIFVCSMTDLFADFVPDEWIDRVFAVMALSPQHIFQVLTKRAARMREYLASRNGMGNAAICDAINHIPSPLGNRHGALEMPLPNVWLGVSTERQQEADERIPLLLQTPAAVRFISAEPLLGPLDISDYLVETARSNWPWYLDWIIAGGESGHGARPMSIQWVRELRDQCIASETAFFFKQWGEWAPAGACRSEDPGRYAFGDYEHDRSAMHQVDGYPRQFTKFGARSTLKRVGKKAGGRLLDGVLHNAMPTVRP